MRLVEQEALDGAAAYRALDFLADVRKGIWSEFYNGTAIKVDPYRRNLQRAYVETLADRINGRLAAVDDTRAFFRGELKALDADLRRRLCAPPIAPRASTSTTCERRSQRALDHTVLRSAAAGGGRERRDFSDDDLLDVDVDPESCWVDYAIGEEVATGVEPGFG